MARYAARTLTHLFMLVVASACSEGSADDPSDASQTADSDAATKIPDAQIDADASPTAIIEAARRSFAELAQQHGGRYWYELEHCVARSSSGGSRYVVVENGVARNVASRQYPRSECEHVVDTWLPPENATFPDLFDVCAAVLGESPGPSQLILDPAGIIETCYYRAARPPCSSEYCGRGYHVRSWGFGELPNAWAPYDDAGAKCVDYQATWRFTDTNDAGVVSPLYRVGPCRSFTVTEADGGMDCRTLPDLTVSALADPLTTLWTWTGMDAGTAGYPTEGRVTELELRAPSPAPAQHARIGDDCALPSSCRSPDLLTNEVNALRRISLEYRAYPQCAVTP